MTLVLGWKLLKQIGHTILEDCTLSTATNPKEEGCGGTGPSSSLLLIDLKL